MDFSLLSRRNTNWELCVNKRPMPHKVADVSERAINFHFQLLEIKILGIICIEIKTLLRDQTEYKH